MKLDLKFVPLEACVYKKISSVLLLASLVFFMLGVFFIYDTLTLEDMMPTNNLNEKEGNTFHAVALPKLSEVEHEAEKVELINHLLAGYPKYLSSLLYFLEKNLPQHAFLTSLSYNKRSSEMKMEVRAKQEDLLRIFVENLEKHPDVREVSYEKGIESPIKKIAIIKIRLRLLK